MMTKHSIHSFGDTLNPWYYVHVKNDQISEEKINLKIINVQVVPSFPRVLQNFKIP